MMNQGIKLYRGHKDEDFRKSNYRALSFTESLTVAVQYGMGANDAGNASVADGFVTTVTFLGTLIDVPENGLGNVDRHIDKYAHHDGIRFRDGVIAILKTDLLVSVSRARAADAQSDLER